jgi:hypothetical protein
VGLDRSVEHAVTAHVMIAGAEHSRIAFNVRGSAFTMLPPNVQELIAGSVSSSAALELLLLLRRSPDTYWTATAAAATLGASEERMSAALQSLRQHGLVEQARETVAFRYAPRNDEAREAVEALASAYDHQRVAVLDAVYAAATGAIEAFAEAFRIRSR